MKITGESVGMKNGDMGMLRGLGKLQSLGIAQSRACREAVAALERLAVGRDCCRAHWEELVALRAENERLRAKLHMTRDGEPVTEGDSVFTIEQDESVCRRLLKWTKQPGEIVLLAHGGYYNAVGIWRDQWHKPNECYSSREAAEEAL